MSGAFPPLTFIVMEGENVELEELFVVQLFISPVRSQMDRPRAFHGMIDSRPASATSPRCGRLNIPPAACAATFGGDGTRVEATDTGDTFGPCISAMSGAFPPLTFVVMEGENVELEELFVVQLFISPVRSQMDRPRAFHGMIDSRPASATSPRCGRLNIPPAACAATSGTVMSGAFELPL